MICFSYFDRLNRKVSDWKNKPEEVFSECGSEIGTTYEYKTVNGIKNLVKTGKVNRQEIIDSYAEESDLVNQIQKFMNGDTSVCNPSSGVYGDFTEIPNTYAAIFERVNMCQNVFDSMPVEIKREFDNSYESFWTQFGTDRFNDIFDKFNKVEDVKEPVIESEVKLSAE